MDTVSGTIDINSWFADNRSATLGDLTEFIYDTLLERHGIPNRIDPIDPQRYLIELPWGDSRSGTGSYRPVIDLSIDGNDGTLSGHSVNLAFGVSNSTYTDHSTWDAVQGYTSNCYRIYFSGVVRNYIYRFVKINNADAYIFGHGTNYSMFPTNTGIVCKFTKLTDQSKKLNGIIIMPGPGEGRNVKSRIVDETIVSRSIAPPAIQNNSEGVMLYPCNDGLYKANDMYYSSRYFTLMNNMKKYNDYPTPYYVFENAFTIQEKSYDMVQVWDTSGDYTSLAYESG